MKIIFFLQKTLIKLRILPSWVIFFIDAALVALTSFISYIFFKQLGIVFYQEFPFIVRYAITILTYLGYLLLFKTHTGIIRYSTLNDIGRVLNAVLSSFTTLVLFDSLYYYVTERHVFVIYSLFYSSFLIFFSLIAFRIFVKLLFQNLSKKNILINKANIAIIGVNPHNISIIESLNSFESLFNLVCFLDINPSLNGKKVAGINIFANNKRPLIFYLRWKGIKNIVLTKDYLPEAIESKLIDDCIKCNIKVFKPELIENHSIASNETLKSYNLEELLFRETIEVNNVKIIEQFKSKIILVTGGAGSIGSQLAKQIINFEPKKLIILDQAETPLHDIELYFNNKKYNCEIDFELIDVTNFNELETVFKKHNPEIVFHAAAYKHVPILEKNYKQAIKVNIFGTKNCVDLSLKYCVHNFVFISTDKAVNPTNIMGASKRFAEMLSHSAFNSKKNSHKTQIVATRFGNVLGSNGSAVHLFQEQIKTGGPLTVTHPEVNRFFMTIPEACKLVIEAAAMGTGGQTYLFDMGKSIKIVDLAEKMIRLAGKTPNKDIQIVYTGLRPGEKLYEEVLTESAETLPTYHPKIVIAKEENPSIETIEDSLVFLKKIQELEKEEVVNHFKSIIPGLDIK
jgi:FlaA1/EpsC-like NDP-sugar epimerase